MNSMKRALGVWAVAFLGMVFLCNAAVAGSPENNPVAFGFSTLLQLDGRGPRQFLQQGPLQRRDSANFG